MNEIKESLHKIGMIKYLGFDTLLYGVVDASIKKIEITWTNNQLICKSPVAGEFDLSTPLKKFYKKECRKIINEKIRAYQPLFKEKVKSVTIESSKVRWGSCDSNRELTFHWQLILYPIEALEYVVIHEMCHMSHLNHDRSFWRLVGKHCPNYKEDMKIIGSEKTRGL